MPEPDRGALLASIQKGTRLKKATTNDRSAPAIGKASSAGPSGGGVTAERTVGSSGGGAVPPAGPMGMGGLFAGGMPKLRSTGSRILTEDVDSRSASQRQQSVPTVQAPTLSRPAPTPRSMSTTVTKASVVGGAAVRSAPPPLQNRLSSPTMVGSEMTPPPVRPPLRRPLAPSGTTDSPGRLPPRPAPSSAGEESAKPPPPSITTTTTTTPLTRPPLPTRPAPPTPKMQNLSLEERRGEGLSPMLPKLRHVSMQEPSTPQSPAVAFPSESLIPKPLKHSGRCFVYPSGRIRGTFIDEPSDEGIAAAQHSTRDLAHLIRFLTNLGSAPSRQSAPITRTDSLHSSATTVSLIQSRLRSLERELAEAIAAQEFEECVQLKQRITKLKELLDRTTKGLAVDPSEIDSIQ